MIYAFIAVGAWIFTLIVHVARLEARVTALEEKTRRQVRR